MLKKTLCCVLAFLSLFTITAEAKPKKQKTKGQAYISLKLDANKTDFSEKEKEELRELGWTITDEIVSRDYSYGNGTIEIAGVEVQTDENGDFEIDNSLIENDTIDINIHNNKKKVKKNKNNKFQVQVDVDLDKFLEDMDTDSEAGISSRASGGTSYSAGARVTCNRFNGYKGDQKYYSSHTSAQSLKNFSYSDCDWALALWTVQCVRDYTSYRYCTNYTTNPSNAARCSDWADINPLAEHSRRYHKHTSINGPRSY